VAARLTTENPLMAVQLEAALTEGLRKLDERQARNRERVGESLADEQQALAADADAPAALKSAAAQMTLDKLLDREGNYAALRGSVKVARAGGELSAEMRIPEGVLQNIARGGSLTSTAAMVGVLAAIAIPNFVKFQCRSKQAEAKINLKAAYTTQMAFRAEKNSFGKTFEEIGFQPEAGRYTICMNGQCLPCAGPACRPLEPGKNPCLEMVPPQDPPVLRVCAAADLGDGKLDVWAIEQAGIPENLRNGCQ
jgi:hypothetical protein